jgi:hypothetical protein
MCTTLSLTYKLPGRLCGAGKAKRARHSMHAARGYFCQSSVWAVACHCSYWHGTHYKLGNLSSARIPARVWTRGLARPQECVGNVKMADVIWKQYNCSARVEFWPQGRPKRGGLTLMSCHRPPRKEKQKNRWRFMIYQAAHADFYTS